VTQFKIWKPTAVGKKTYINIAIFIEPCETFEWSPDVFSWYVANLLRPENTNEPPVAIAIVHQDEAVAFYNAGLTLDSRSEAMERVDQVKVD